MTNFIDIHVAEKFATDLIQHLPPSLTFHNWQHTAEVVETAMEIAGYCCLEKESTLLLKLAALFHDTGYRDSYRQHENRSIIIAHQLLSPYDLTIDDLITITGCIEATKIPQKPKNLLEQILCDADLAHFARTDYQLYADRLRQEWSIWLRKDYTDQQWNKENLTVLSEHRYKTEYGQRFLQPKKEGNILLLQSG